MPGRTGQHIGARSQPPAGHPIRSSETQLERLAAQGKLRRTWPGLRQYAATAKNPEQRGRAYLVLGYNEYAAGQYAPAAADLGRATATAFGLAEIALYYEAEAAQAAQQPARVVEALQDFPAHYPQSVYHEKALEMLGQALLKTNQPAKVTELISKEPALAQRVSLQLLLARGLWQARQLNEAVRAFQEIYYNSPNSPESEIAGSALKNLQAQMGPTFPAATLEQRRRRADLLFKTARWEAAFQDYDTLLAATPPGPESDAVKVHRGRCLVYLRRAQEALNSLAAGDWRNSPAAADRLATLVLAYQQMNDQPQMLQSLEELASNYSHSSAYADALWATGNFYVRQEDWKTAARYYQPLTQGAAPTFQVREAAWRFTWSQYLEGERDKARPAILDYLARFPGSPHTGSALYWLGRLSEQSNDAQAANAAYDLLIRRLPHSYFARQAAVRRESLPMQSSVHRSLPERTIVLRDSGTQPEPRTVVSDQILLPASPAPLLCPPGPSGASSPILQPLVVLKALHLNGLAEQYLRTAVIEHRQDPALLLALSRTEREEGNIAAALFDAGKLVPDYTQYSFSELPAEIWRLLYPNTYWNLVQRQARLNHLDPYLVMGLIRQESAFNPKATSGANARGLMQMLPGTAGHGLSRRRRRQVSRRLYDPAYNIRIACRYLRQMIRAFDGNLEQALAAYNAGDSRVREWLRARSFRDAPEFLESIPFRDTRYYVEALLRDAAIYRQMMSGKITYKRCG